MLIVRVIRSALHLFEIVGGEPGRIRSKRLEWGACEKDQLTDLPFDAFRRLDYLGWLSWPLLSEGYPPARALPARGTHQSWPSFAESQGFVISIYTASQEEEEVILTSGTKGGGSSLVSRASQSIGLNHGCRLSSWKPSPSGLQPKRFDVSRSRS